MLDNLLPEGPCAAGREADFGGKWKVPCQLPAPHVLAFGDESGWDRRAPVVRFCDPHFKELLAAGLIEEPYLDPEEAERRLRNRR